MWREVNSRFPIRILVYKQHQLAVISDKNLTSSESVEILQNSMAKELRYIKSWKQTIDQKSAYWFYYKFMETKLLSECLHKKQDLAECILIHDWSVK